MKSKIKPQPSQLGRQKRRETKTRMESCFEQIVSTGITHQFTDSMLLPKMLKILKGLKKRAEFFFLILPQIISDKYVFSLKKGLRVTFNAVRKIT